MAETEVLEPVVDSIKDAVAEILNETAVGEKNVTMEERLPLTPEGIAIAYGSLVFMALLPIFLGSFRSPSSLTVQ